MKCVRLLEKSCLSFHVIFTPTNYVTRSFLRSKSSGVLKKMSDHVFPKTLMDFGYGFDQGGKLRKIDRGTGLLTEDGFEFNVSEDLSYNQKRYEALGEIVDQHVYDLLEKEGLNKLPVPKDPEGNNELKTFVFGSEDIFRNDKLMVLIHGSGVVRAGQWARRLIINDSLESGSQLGYIRKARGLGYAVLVFNTNDNFRTVRGGGLWKKEKKTEIPGSGDPHSHVETVWKDYIRPSIAKHIAIVAHSYGGVCVVKFALDHPQDFQTRVFAVGLTDSVHTMPKSEPGAKNTDYIVKVARNWVSSGKPLDTPERTGNGDIERYSAGHSTHEMTSYCCIESLFKFIENQYTRRSTSAVKSDQ